MTFETPAALWGLLSLLLLAIFSLWRQGAVRQTVPSLALWKKIAERNPPLRALRRPRWRLDLLFQALAIAAVVGALAGPLLATSRKKPRAIALVVDTSARFRAGDRLERLKEEARKLLSGDLAGDTVTFYAASPEPRRVESLDEIRIVDEHVDLAPLLAAARQGAAHVIVLSDRPVEGVPSVLVGSAGGNLGIVECTADETEIFIRIANHGPAREVPIRLTVGGETKVFPETVPSGGRSWHRTGDFAKVDSIEVELGIDDEFRIDNRVRAQRLASPRAVVSVTGQPNASLEAALRAVSGVVLGEGPALLAVGNEAPPGKAPFTVEIRPPSPRFTTDAIRGIRHPLLEGIADFRAIGAAGVGEIPVEGGEPLLTADGKVVAAIRGRSVRLSVDLHPEAWPSHSSFPLFWANVIDWARRGSASLAVIRTGRPFALPGDVTGVEPAGGGASGTFLAHTAGRHVLRRPGEVREIEANLLDERESDTKGTTRGLDWKGVSEEGREAVSRPLAGVAAALALLFLALAWLLARRSD